MTEMNSMEERSQQRTNPHFGEVHNAYFPFEEDPTRGKVRPVIVVSEAMVELPNGKLVEKDSLTEEELKTIDIQKIYHNATKVTSRHRVYDEFDVLIDNWQESGLNHESTARCAKTMALPIQNFRDFRGYLDIQDLQNVMESINKLLDSID
ncbi:hypothetical protein [Clostridium perfringens]|uniref:hypothetical protein n=1 Tax=Clostridium perfringens TaxID=1502 RepID=UPI0013E40AE8|nr:hypothetical protein [Clostridium perfringens]NGT54868.1 hypothetical protein [Clostridium perfringens]